MEGGVLAEAEAEFREVCLARRVVLGEGHPDTLTAQAALDSARRQQAED
jgi:hypothetical protein